MVDRNGNRLWKFDIPTVVVESAVIRWIELLQKRDHVIGSVDGSVDGHREGLEGTGTHVLR